MDRYLDPLKPSKEEVLRILKDRVPEEKARRSAYGLADLKIPSASTISRHIANLDRDVLDIAREGEKWYKNNRTRGTTDTDALPLGEFCMIDENKLSIISSVYRLGIWETLSPEDQETVVELEEIIKTRLWLVLLLIVASRMPLGWVVTDNPNTEATLAGLSMAFRDKTKEAKQAGCKE